MSIKSSVEWLAEYHQLIVLGSLSSAILVFLLHRQLHWRVATPAPGIARRPSFIGTTLAAASEFLDFLLLYLRTQTTSSTMRHPRQPRWAQKKGTSLEEQCEPEPPQRARQTVEAFLVLDIEGTCDRDSGLDFPNEIIVSTPSYSLSL